MQNDVTDHRFIYCSPEPCDKRLLFIGLNPSHGESNSSNDQNKSDKTIDKIKNLIKTNEYAGYGFIIINLTSQRAPSPKDLKKGIDGENLEEVRAIITQNDFDKVVLFWGNSIKKYRFIKNAIEIKRMIDEKDKDAQWFCVERNRSGLQHPKHFGRMGSIGELQSLDKAELTNYFNDLQAACSN